MSKLAKPDKPSADFPLFAHANGQWAKKIKGRLHYFGLWDNPSAAEALYSKQAADLHAGRKPRAQAEDGVTVKELVNRFLASKKALVDSGELRQMTWADYQESGQRVTDAFGRERLAADLAGDDFEDLRNQLAKKWGPVTLGNEINRIRVLFKWGYDSGYLDRPMRFGPGFKRPSKKTLRQARAAKGVRMFEAEEIRRLLGLSPWRHASRCPLSAMILLGVNCGFGNNDVGTLPTAAVNFDTGWLDFPRPKTGIPRRCKLWPETVAALREVLANRPEPKEAADAGLLFITSKGARWAKDSNDAPISKEMAKLLKSLEMARPGLNFYALRHTFETIGGESRDQVAVNAIMGHAPAGNDMSAVYRERISDDRLAVVADNIRRWLFGTPEADEPKGKPQEPADAQAEVDEPDADEPRILKLRLA